MTSINLSQINLYPIKSVAGISLSHAWVEEKGLAFDRRFVLSDLAGQFITARTEPKLCLIQATLVADGLMLVAPNMPVLAIRYAELAPSYVTVTVWNDKISAQQANNNINQWFNRYLGKPCQLLYFGEESQRKVKQRDTQVSFADGYPLLLIAQSSLSALNSRLTKPVSMAQFRPNLVVSGCDPFAEDSWRHIRIGEVEFEITKPCSRCIFTTINPQTGEKDPRLEPLNTLKKFRRGDDGEVYFGQNLVALNEGTIAVDDPVQILANQSSVFFSGDKTKTNSNTSAKGWSATNSIELTCTDVVDETHDVKTFVFASKDVTEFKYLAGQHLPLELAVAGNKTKRTYTLSSTPTRPDKISITVKRVADGKISNHLNDQLKVGDSIKAFAPEGEFNLSQATTSKLLFITAGSGITPALSMLRAMSDNKDSRQLMFVHSAKMARDLICHDEIATLAKTQGNTKLIYTLTQGVSPSWQGFQGRLDASMLADINDPHNYTAFLCGPAAFMREAKQLLLNIGLPEKQILQESFGARLDEDKPQKKTRTVNILFDSWDKNVKGDNQHTLLEQGEKAGLILPYSCRAGICGSCKVKLESGEVEQLADDGLMANEKEQGYILACSCVPLTDVVISRG